jgi:hypothetical protein
MRFDRSGSRDGIQQGDFLAAALPPDSPSGTMDLQVQLSASVRPRRIQNRSDVERETGCNAPSTNHSVKFIYRLG